MIDVVVKVGGSLARGPRLPALALELARLARGRNIVVLPGGGAFADVVRECDARLGLRPSAAHWAAVAGMDAFGIVLADVIPGARTVRRLDDVTSPGGRDVVRVLLPLRLLQEADPLPHEWAVTSDSIAAWVAGEAGARLLVLLKDARGMAAPVRGAGEAPSGEARLETLARWTGVDRRFATVVREAPPSVWIIDGERPALLRELVQTGRTEGVSLVR